jgi:hypothetical protein
MVPTRSGRPRVRSVRHSSAVEPLTAELGLWHPTGVPSGILSLGDSSEPDPGLVPADLVVIRLFEADSAALEPLIETGTACLGADGVMWVLADRRARRAISSALTRAGFVVDAVLTIPAWPRTAHFIPVATGPLRDGGPRIAGLHPILARALAASARRRGLRALLLRLAPGCGLLASRAGALPPLAWLGELDGRAPCLATVSRSLRPDAPTATVLRYPMGDARPDLVVKVALSDGGRARVDRERAALTSLRPAAAAAGVEVPAVRIAGSSALLETSVIAGRPAATFLRHRARRYLEPLSSALTEWLTEWHRATATPLPATLALLDQLALDAARRVASTATGLDHYVRQLETLAHRLVGGPIVTVATHNDLTMVNVLDRGDGRLGVIDWEEAEPRGLPLTDLWYALADAVARAHRISHAESVEALALGRVPAPRALIEAPAALASRCALSGNQARLAFHACWLRHAANELDRGDGDGPFLAVVRAVARHPGLSPSSSDTP